MDFDSSRKLYKPGQVVPKAGIYKLVHAEHRLPHKASFKAHDKFPACGKCASKVPFKLLLAAGDGAGNGKGK
jgi:hypothetical protein